MNTGLAGHGGEVGANCRMDDTQSTGLPKPGAIGGTTKRVEIDDVMHLSTGSDDKGGL